MRQLLPDPIDEVDPAALLAADERPAPDGRPWVLVNMIATVDGATAVGGVSGPLGGPADKRMFAAVRAVADAVLVGAGTARAERYGRGRRRGDRPPPRIAVVTASGDLDPALPLFAGGGTGDPDPLVLTVAAAPADRVARLSEVAEVVVAGDDRVDLGQALAALAARGVAVAVAEGGPSLNGQLVAGGFVDEWCASLSPTLAAGSSPRPAVGPAPAGGLLPMRLDRLLTEDGFCFARYVRAAP